MSLLHILIGALRIDSGQVGSAKNLASGDNTLIWRSDLVKGLDTRLSTCSLKDHVMSCHVPSAHLSYRPAP